MAIWKPSDGFSSGVTLEGWYRTIDPTGSVSPGADVQSGGSVTNWTDRSGNGRTLVKEGTLTYNSTGTGFTVPTVSSSASGAFRTATGMAYPTGPVSVFMAASIDTDIGTQRLASFITPGGTDVYGDAYGVVPIFNLNSGLLGYFYGFNINEKSVDTLTPMIMSGYMKNTTTGNFSINGHAPLTSTAGVNTTNLDRFGLGTAAHGEGYYTGEISEVVVVFGQMTDADIQKVQSYLAWNNLINCVAYDNPYAFTPAMTSGTPIIGWDHTYSHTSGMNWIYHPLYSNNTDYADKAKGNAPFDYSAVVSRNGYTTGKYYVEIKGEDIGVYQEQHRDYGQGTMVSHDGTVSGDISSGMFSRSRASYTAYSSNVGLAIDFTNHVFWYRVNGGTWQGYANSGTDPVTGVDGIPFADGTIPKQAFVVTSRVENGSTAQIISHDFTYTKPSGFKDWSDDSSEKTVYVGITDDNDDGQARWDNGASTEYWESTGGDLGLGKDGSSKWMYTFLRFVMPSAVTSSNFTSGILSQTINWTVGTDAAVGYLRARAHDDAPAWASGTNSPRTATGTTASVTYYSNNGSKVKNVSNLVDEILGRGGYTPGNHIGFQGDLTGITDTGDALYFNQYQNDRPSVLKLSYTVSTGHTATLATTDANDTLSSNATVAIKGTLAATEANDTLSSNAVGVVSRTATLAATEANDTLSSNSAVAIKATAGIADANDTLSSNSAVAIKATLGVTEADDTLSTAAQVALKGTLAATDANDTLSSSAVGQQNTNGSLSQTDANDTLSSNAVLPIKSASTITDADDTLSTVAQVFIKATLGVTDADDTLGSNSKVFIVGTLTATDADDTLSSNSILSSGRIASVSTTDDDDTLSAVSKIALRGTLSATDDNDTLSTTSQIGTRGTLSLTEGNDTLSASGQRPRVASVNITEQNDTLHSTIALKPYYIKTNPNGRPYVVETNPNNRPYAVRTNTNGLPYTKD